MQMAHPSKPQIASTFRGQGKGTAITAEGTTCTAQISHITCPGQDASGCNTPHKLRAGVSGNKVIVLPPPLLRPLACSFTLNSLVNAQSIQCQGEDNWTKKQGRDCLESFQGVTFSVTSYSANTGSPPNWYFWGKPKEWCAPVRGRHRAQSLPSSPACHVPPGWG